MTQKSINTFNLIKIKMLDTDRWRCPCLAVVRCLCSEKGSGTNI